MGTELRFCLDSEKDCRELSEKTSINQRLGWHVSCSINRQEVAKMKETRKILAPTDLSELSLAGIRYALEAARASAAEVIVYHSIGADELMHCSRSELLSDVIGLGEKSLSQFLNARCADLLPHVNVRTKVELGAAAASIVDEAKRENADLIVMSTHGRTGFSHVLVGSVTERVVRHAPCPVLSIHPAKETAAEAVA
jgi:universal stress protein A